MEPSDGRLATVSYLFGEPPSEHPAATEPPTAVWPRFVDEAQAAPEPAAGKAARAGGAGFDRVNNVSMHALTRRGMSSAEMAALLNSREVEPDEVAAEIARLESVGLIDDLALAETLVRTLHERKGLGRSAIRAELKRRKVDAEAVDAALERLDADDDLAKATELALKRAPQLRSFDHETAKRRLSGYLMRRGYSGSVLSAAIAAALAPQSGPRFR